MAMCTTPDRALEWLVVAAGPRCQSERRDDFPIWSHCALLDRCLGGGSDWRAELCREVERHPVGAHVQPERGHLQQHVPGGRCRSCHQRYLGRGGVLSSRLSVSVSDTRRAVPGVLALQPESSARIDQALESLFEGRKSILVHSFARGYPCGFESLANELANPLGIQIGAVA